MSFVKKINININININNKTPSLSYFLSEDTQRRNKIDIKNPNKAQRIVVYSKFQKII